jgi:hypothetical protein
MLKLMNSFVLNNKFLLQLKRPSNVAKICLAILISLVMAACSSSSTKTTSSSPNQNSSATTSQASGTSSVGSYAGLNLSKLGSLTNYTAQITENGKSLVILKVHSPSDWEQSSAGSTSANSNSSTSININGSQYLYTPTVSGTQVTYSWQKSGPADSYAQSGYPGMVQGFIGLTKVSGVKLVKTSSCTQAGLTGHIWVTKPAVTGAVAPNISACIADSSGVLLTYDQGVSSSIYGQAASNTTTFSITGINNVPLITVP